MCGGDLKLSSYLFTLFLSLPSVVLSLLCPVRLRTCDLGFWLSFFLGDLKFDPQRCCEYTLLVERPA
jgi:hypothetical protein